MRALKKILLSLILFIALLLVTVLGTGYWAIKNPQQAWTVVERRFLPNDLQIRWEDMHLRIEQAGNWRVQGLWRAEGLQIRKGNPSFSLPIEKVAVSFTLQKAAGQPYVIIHQIDLQANNPSHIALSPSEKKEPAPESQSLYQMVDTQLQLLQRYRNWFVLQSAHLEVKQFKLYLPGQAPLLIAAKVDRTQQGESNWPIDVQAKVTSDGKMLDLVDFKGQINLPESESRDLAIFNGDVTFQRQAAKIKTDLQLNQKSSAYELLANGNIQWRQKSFAIKAFPKIQASLDQRNLKLNLQSRVMGLPGPVAQLRDLKIDANIPQEKNQFWSKSASTVHAQAPVQIFFIDKDLRPPLEKACNCRIPEELLVDVNAQGWLHRLFENSNDRATVADIDVKVQNYKNKLISVNGAGSLKIDKQSDHYFFQPLLDTEIVIHSYQGIRRFLDAKNIMIPAPLDVLDGEISLQAKGGGNSTMDVFQIPVLVQTKLSSRKQLVDLKANTNIEVRLKEKLIDVNVKAAIRDLQLEMPPIDPLAGLPKFMADRRILMKPRMPASTASYKVQFSFEVETSKPSAIRLYSNLADPYVPLSLKVGQQKKQDPTGSVRVEPFEITYLNRRLAVEDMQVSLRTNSQGAYPVEGRFHIDQTLYRIFIEVGGTTKNPQVTLTSDPDLPREEIINVLLFDRTSSELVETDAQTSGSFQAALADRAIGLFGLWAFATTPIRSFSYDPVRKVYSATIVLGPGLTAGIGTNWEEATHFELRQRVSKRWVLIAQWAPNEARDKADEKLVLRWEKRF